jgi:hypothetical protein
MGISAAMNETDEDEILTEARRAITFQAASLDELRSRTGLLLAAASVSASFLGAATAKGGGNLGFWGGAALVAFVGAIGCCIWVLMPRRDGWTFITSPTTLKKDWIDTQRPTESMKLFLATALENHYDENAREMADLYVFFQVAAGSVAAEVILGAIQIAT